MTPGRRPGASTALLFRVGDDVELRGTAPPVRATVVAVQSGRGPTSVRIAYRGPHGTEVRCWVTPAALRQMTVQQALQGYDSGLAPSACAAPATPTAPGVVPFSPGAAAVDWPRQNGQPQPRKGVSAPLRGRHSLFYFYRETGPA